MFTHWLLDSLNRSLRCIHLRAKYILKYSNLRNNDLASFNAYLLHSPIFMHRLYVFNRLSSLFPQNNQRKFLELHKIQNTQKPTLILNKSEGVHD